MILQPAKCGGANAPVQLDLLRLTEAKTDGQTNRQLDVFVIALTFKLSCRLSMRITFYQKSYTFDNGQKTIRP